MLRCRVPIAPQDYVPHAKAFGNYMVIMMHFIKKFKNQNLNIVLRYCTSGYFP